MAIHLWNTKRLAVALAQRKVSSEEKFLYLLAGNSIWAAAGYIGSLFDSLFVTQPGVSLFWYEGFLVVVVSVFGSIRCRDRYQGAVDDRLLENFLILGVPLTVKLLLFSWLAYFGISWGFHWLVSDLSLSSDSPVTLISFVLKAIYRFHAFLIAAVGSLLWYWWLSIHLETVAAGRTAPNPPLNTDAPANGAPVS